MTRILAALLVWFARCWHRNRSATIAVRDGRVEYWCPDCDKRWSE